MAARDLVFACAFVYQANRSELAALVPCNIGGRKARWAMARKAVCFVDDRDEIRRFRDNMSDSFIVGVGLSPNEALGGLQGKPDVILLDLYYGPETPPALRAEIEEADEQLTRSEERVRILLAKAGQSPDSGFDLAQTLKKRYRGVPIAFFSRKAFLKDALRAQKAGYPLFEEA